MYRKVYLSMMFQKDSIRVRNLFFSLRYIMFKDSSFKCQKTEILVEMVFLNLKWDVKVTLFRIFYLLYETTHLVWQHRVVNSLIDFLSELLILLIMKNEQIMSEWAMRSKKWVICSLLVSALSNSLTLLIFGERPERFAHIAH